MKSIYASKLYKASKRKDRIQAALGALSNAGLVAQLASNLDEEYRTPENLGKEPKPQAEPQGNDLFVDEEIDPEKDLVTVNDIAKGASGGGSHSSPSHALPKGPKPSLDDGPSDIDLPDGPKPDLDDLSDEPSDEPDDKPEPEPAEASTKITSSEQVDLTVLKDSLNNREDTHGVSRIAEKENEIWIYYKDEVNLNNIMTDVIEYLMIGGWPYLEFNRLARSDNAIVFLQVEATNPEPLEDKDNK